ncbi:MAG TPA: AsmA family protein [Candidatus Eisenbacteria bacterium]|nr:AsmA family protein [Candidatus Eisenbacteria bacterium]
MNRRVAIAACALAVIVAVALFGSRVLVDADAYKARFEAAASDPLGLQIRVGGPLAFAFNGDLLLVMRDLHVTDASGAEVLSADRAEAAVAVLPLLFGKRHVRRIELSRPKILLTRDRAGALNWSRRAKPRGSRTVFDRARLTIRDGAVRYVDESTTGAVVATGVNAKIRDLRDLFAGGPSALSRASFRGDVSLKSIRSETLAVTDMSFRANARRGVLDLDPVAMRVFGGEGSASLRADLTDSIPRFRTRYTLSRFDIDQCLRVLSADTIATGAMDFAGTLAWTGRTPAEWKRSMNGEVVLSGRELLLRGQNLDHELSKFESSQSFNLLDVGSFFFAGPLGMAVTKGYDFARLVKRSDGGTRIRTIMSSWTVEGGALHANDVAMATEKNRMALTGRVDFVEQRFDSVTVAVVDEDGCAKVRQELRGTFQAPELTKPSILSALLGPARKVVTGAKDLLPLGPCTPFYAGSVPAPK